MTWILLSYWSGGRSRSQYGSQARPGPAGRKRRKERVTVYGPELRHLEYRALEAAWHCRLCRRIMIATSLSKRLGVNVNVCYRGNHGTSCFLPFLSRSLKFLSSPSFASAVRSLIRPSNFHSLNVTHHCSNLTLIVRSLSSCTQRIIYSKYID